MPCLPRPFTPHPKRWADTGLHAAWLGHSTVLLKIDGFTILTDPILGARCGVRMGPVTLGLRRLVAPAVSRAQLPHIDLILLSHAHFDHFDLATLRSLERAGTAVVTAKYTSDLLRVRRYQSVQEVGWGERVRVGPLSILGIRVKHWGARMRSDVHRGFNGYLIESRRGIAWCLAATRRWTDSVQSGARDEAGGSGDPADWRVRSVDSRALQSGGGLAHGRRLRRRTSAAGASPDVPAEPRTLSGAGGAFLDGGRQPIPIAWWRRGGAGMVAHLAA